MRSYYFILFTFFTCLCLSAQIGINTDEPTAALDINGDARIRIVPVKNTFSQNEKVLIVDEDGNIKKASLSDVYRQLNINNTVYSGRKSATSLLNIDIGSNYNPIVLETTELGDTHYNINTGAYTVPEDGVYNIVFYYKNGTGLNVSLSLFTSSTGIAIVKQKFGETIFSTLDNINFGGVSVLGINVNLSEAMLNRTFALKKGDKIYLAASSSLLSVNLLSSTKATGHIYKISN